MSVVPAVRVFQLFESSTPLAGVTLDACLIGPNYKVLDYLRAEDKQIAFAGKYDSLNFQVLQYPGRDPGDDVDQDSVQVFFDNLKAELFTGIDGSTNSLEPRILTATTGGFYFEDFVDKDGVLHPVSPLLHSRGAKVGDFVKISGGPSDYEAKILEIQSSPDASVILPPVADALNHENLSYVDVFNPFPSLTENASGATDMLVGVKGVYREFVEDLNTYTITVTTTGLLGTAVFNVSDTGTDLPGGGVDIPTVAGQNEYSVGNRGLIVYLEENGATGLDGAGDWDTVATIPSLSDGNIEKAGAFGSSEIADIEYTITVIEGNNQGLNSISVTTPSAIDNSGPTQITSGVSFPVGNKGARALINLPSGSKLTPGDSWILQARAGGHGDVVVIAGAGADTITPLGSYLGSEDAVLRVSNTVPGAFGVATFDWEIYQAGFTSAAARRPSLASGSISTLASEDSSTVYNLALGIDINLIDDSGSFTAAMVWEANLLSDFLEQPVVSSSHDLVPDTPAVELISAVGDVLNYNLPGAVGGVGPGTGTLAESGRYFHYEDTIYTVDDTTGGAVSGTLGTAILAVTDTGSDVGTQLIQTEAGVLTYRIGSRGVEIVLSSDFDSGGALAATIACTGIGDMEINTGYSFNSPIVYTITCTVAGALGTAEFSYVSTGNVDNGSFVSIVAQTEYDLGTRGIILTLNEGSAGYTVGHSWVVDTTKDSRLIAEEDHTYCVEISKTGDFGLAEVFIVSNLGDSTGPFVLNEDSDPRQAGNSLPFKVGNFGIQARLEDGRRAAFPDEPALFHAGDKWVIQADAEVPRGKNRLRLDKTIPSGLLDLSGLTYILSIPLNDVNIPPTGSTNWETDETTITMYPGIKVTSPDVFDIVLGEPVLFKMSVQSGADMYVTYRALVTAASATIDSVSSVSEIEGKLGRIEPDNVLAYGAFKALQNSNTNIKFLRISSDDDVGYQEAIDVLENADNVYALVPLTQDKTVIEAFDQHVDLMSSPDRGAWRILIANRELDVSKDILVDRIDPISGDSVDLEGIFIDDPDATDLTPPIFTRLEDPLATFLSSGVQAGDLVLTDYVNGVPQSSYPVDNVIAEDILILFDGPSAAILSSQKYEIVRTLSKDEQADAHAGIAQAFLDRRVYLVWPDRVEIDGEEVPGFHLCAAIAGMVAGFPPHQGFTNLAMAGFDAVPRTTNYFNRSQLDVMALAGIYIVTQKSEGSSVFARHQLSTDRTSIETQELSITKNLDFLSFYFKQLLEPFIGVWNVTEDALIAIRNVLKGGIEFQRAQLLPRIGAPLIDANILSLVQNELLKDTVDIEMEVQLPFPLNFINLRLRVT
jgi:hypothetical protein